MSVPDPAASRAPHSVAERVRRLRGHLGWTQAQLARAAGLSAGTVSRVERGEERPRGATAQRLAGSLGVTVDELLGLSAGQPALFSSAEERRMALVRRVAGLDDDELERVEAALLRALDRLDSGARTPRRRKARGDGKPAP